MSVADNKASPVTLVLIANYTNRVLDSKYNTDVD